MLLIFAVWIFGAKNVSGVCVWIAAGPVPISRVGSFNHVQPVPIPVVVCEHCCLILVPMETRECVDNAS